jgi:hypothetical protein
MGHASNVRHWRLAIDHRQFARSAQAAQIQKSKPEHPMKIILPLIRRLFGDRNWPETKRPAGTAPETAGKPPDPIARQPERSSFADDDSPPGHKIRWHL